MSKKNQKSAKSENSFFMQGDQKIIVGTKLEAKDFSGEWYPARVVKIKSDEKMILVHFERWSSRFDIWLPFNSDQIRMLKCNKTKEKKWRLGDRIVAKWGPAAKMYPATISKFVSESIVEITFYDGIKKNINKASLKSDTEKLYRQFCFGLPRKQIIASNKLESSSEQSRPSNKGKRKLSETISKSDLIKSDLHLKKPFKSQNLLTDAVESNNDLKQISSSRTSRNNSLCSSHIKPLQNLEQKEKLLSEKKHCIQYLESAKGNEINFSDNSLKCIAYKSQILTSKLNIFPKSSNSVAIMKKNAHEYVMFPVVSEEEKIEKKNFNNVTQLLSSSENDKLAKIKDCQKQVKSVKHHITTLLPSNESGSVLLHSNEYDSVLLSSNESDSVLSNYIPLNIHEISIPHENQLTNCSKTTLIKKLPSNIEPDLLESIKENCSLIKSFDNGNETPTKIKLSEINTLMNDQTLKNKDQTLKIKDQTQVTNNGDRSTKQLSSDDDQSTIQESNNVTQSSLQLSSDCNQLTLLLSSRSNPTTLQIPVDQDQLILQIPKSDQLGLQSSNIGVQSTLKILNDSNKSNKDETSTFQVLNSSDQSNQGETLQVYIDCDQSIVCDKLPLKKCNYCDQSNNGNQPSLQISSHCDLLNDSYQSTLQISNNWDQSNSDIPLPLQLSNSNNHSNVDQLTIQVSNDCDQSILLVSNKGELATSHLSNNSNQLNKINDDHVSNNCKQLTSRLLNDEQIKLHVPEGFNQTTLHVLNDGEQITKKHLVDHNVINMKNSFKPLFNKSKLVSADSFQQRRSNRERKEKKFIDDIDHKIKENIKKGLLDAICSVNEVTSGPQSNCKTKTKINLKSKPDTKIKNEIASPKFEEQVPLNENKETSISEVCKKKIKTSVLNKEVPANFKKQRKCKKFEDKYELFKKKWKEEKEKRRKIQNDSETTDNHFFDKKKENNKSIDILEENDKTSDFKKLTPFSNDELGLETKTNHESILLVKVNNNSDEEGKIKVPVFQSKLVDESVPENNEFVLNKVVDEMDLNAKNLHSKDLNIAYNNSDFLDIVCNSDDKKILASNLNNEFNSSCVKPKRNRGRPAKVKVGIINNDINKLLGIKRRKQLSITKDSCTPGDTMSMASMVSKIPFYVKKQVTPMLHSENADKSPLPVSNILSKQPPESSSFKTINQSLIYREDSDIKHSRSDSNNAEVSVSNIAVENAFVLQKESDESIIVIQQSLDEVENSNHFSTNNENINNRDFSAKNLSEKSYDVSDKLNEINLTDIKLYGKKNEPKLRNRKFSVDFIAGQLKSKHKLFQKKCHLLQKHKSMNIPLQKKFSKAIKSKKLVKKSAINIVNDMSKKLKSKNIKKVSMYSSSFVSTLTPQQYSQEKQNDNNDVYSASIENKFLNLNDGLNMLPELKVQMHSAEDMCFDVIGMKNKGLLKISNTSVCDIKVCGNTPVCDIKTESDASQLSTNIQQGVYKKCYNDDSGDNKICNRSMVSSKDSKFDSKQQQKKQRKNKMLQKCEKKIQMRHAESSVSVYTPVVSLKEDVEVSPVDIEKLNFYESTETESESEGELPSVDDCVKCLCEDDCELGFMIQCEQCLTWQHGECVGYAQPKDVPLFYLCHICSNPKGLRSASMFDNDYTWYRHGYLPPVSPPVTSHPCVPSLLVDQENKDVLSSIMMITHAMITELFVIREIHQEVRNRCLFYGHQDIQKDLSLNHTRDHSFIEENGINTSIYGNHDNVSPNSINMLKVCSMENIEESQIDHKTNGFYSNKNDKSKQMRNLNEVYSEVHYQSKSISNQIKNNNNGKIEFDESLDSANGTNTKIDLSDNLNLKNLSMQHGLSMLEFFHNCQYNSDTKKYLLTQYKLLSELESIEKIIDLRLKLIDKKLSEIEMEYDIINQKTVLNEIVGVTNLSNLLSYLHSRKWNRVIDVISSIQEI